MRVLFGFISLAGIILGMIIGYALVNRIVPEYMPMWWTAQVLMILGLVGNEYAKGE